MTLLDQIRAGTRQVVAALGEAWTYKSRSSAPGVEPVTWGAAVPFVALPSGRRVMLEDDGRTTSRKRVERQRLRCSDLVVIPVGAEAIDPTGVVWSVAGPSGESHIESSGPGTIAYHLQRELTSATGTNRGGGI